MHAHEDLLVSRDLSLHQSEVLALVHEAAVADHPEVAQPGGEVRLGDASDQPLLLEPVGDQLCDGDETQPVLAGEDLELGTARHGAVLLEDLADDSGRPEAGEASEVHRRLGLADPAEHPSRASAQREDVAGTAQVSGTRGRVHQQAHGRCAVVRADAGAHPETAVSVHGDRERRTLGVGVLVGHGREVQLVRPLLGERDADEPPTVPGHEVDPLGGDRLGGAHQVTFVLPVLVVRDDDHPALADILQGVLDAIEGGDRLGARHGSWPGSGERTTARHGASILPTYFPIRSPSRLTGSPARS